jgi:hypothetical protein
VGSRKLSKRNIMITKDFSFSYVIELCILMVLVFETVAHRFADESWANLAEGEAKLINVHAPWAGPTRGEEGGSCKAACTTTTTPYEKHLLLFLSYPTFLLYVHSDLIKQWFKMGMFRVRNEELLAKWKYKH